MSDLASNDSAISRANRSTSALKSSASLQRSNSGQLADALFVAALLAGVVAIAIWWVFRHGYILYYGDAQSHLNLSRSIIDSRTPGYDQLGTVWLPMLHLICLPFVSSMKLWSTGLAGAIPVAFCFVIAGTVFFLAARETYQSRTAAWVAILCLALNPNLLYLASIPMTEVVFLAGLTVLLLALIRFEATKQARWILLGIIASWWMSLTRYDGWFLLPFAALWFARSAKAQRWQTFLVFSLLATLAPLYWMAHNWWETSNPLDFYNGPYSAMAIQAGRPYPGYHYWLISLLYYVKAGQLCAGWTLLLLGLGGFTCAFASRKYRPVLFLLLTPAFYIWSMHSSGDPIFVPQLPPYSYYNSRYGIAMVAFSSFTAGALVVWLQRRWKRFIFAVPVIAVLPWLLWPSQDNWICWKESQVNSESRRAWMQVAAEFFHAHYVRSTGILTPSASDDFSGVYCRAGIPLRETINIGNGPAWIANTARPELLHQQLWAVDQKGDALSKVLTKPDSPYHLEREISVKDATTVEIFRRTGK